MNVYARPVPGRCGKNDTVVSKVYQEAVGKSKIPPTHHHNSLTPQTPVRLPEPQFFDSNTKWERSFPKPCHTTAPRVTSMIKAVWGSNHLLMKAVLGEAGVLLHFPLDSHPSPRPQKQPPWSQQLTGNIDFPLDWGLTRPPTSGRLFLPPGNRHLGVHGPTLGHHTGVSTCMNTKSK